MVIVISVVRESVVALFVVSYRFVVKWVAVFGSG